MKYFELNFNIKAPAELMQDACDLLAALTAEAGLETFEETADGMKGYAQQTLLDRDLLQQIAATFPMEGVGISYNISEAEERDWNEQWEQEGFAPIVVANRIVIHDGRHLPEAMVGSQQATLTNHQGDETELLPIEIDAHMAFGTGTHETTRMVVSTLLKLDLRGCNVLDCGCGTGILGIVALKLGASHCTSYDIDEWSTDNTRHNAVINQVELTPLLGDASVLDTVTDQFDVVMANINRNILLADMPRFREKLRPGGTIILSGFYSEDIPTLLARADQLGMQLSSTLTDNNWACIRLVEKNTH